MAIKHGKLELEAQVDELGIGRYCNSGGLMGFIPIKFVFGVIRSIFYVFLYGIGTT